MGRTLLTLVVVVILVLWSPTLNPLGSTHAPLDRDLRLETARNRLVTAGGQAVVLRGVNLYAVPFYLSSDNRAVPALVKESDEIYAHRRSVFRAIRAAGANAVRIALSTAVFDSLRAGSQARHRYLQRLVTIVHAATSVGLYVDLGWWDALFDGASFPNEYRLAFPMMAQVARRLASDPRVFYEPDNEPWGISWPEWLSVMKATVRYWRTTIGYRGLLIIDTDGYSWDLSVTPMRDLLRAAPALPDGTANIAFANHRYANAMPCFCGERAIRFENQFSRYYSSFPMVGTEYGIYDGVGAAQLKWGRQFLAYLHLTALSNGLDGAFAFIWNWVNADSMTTGVAGPLTAWGRVVKRELLDARR